MMTVTGKCLATFTRIHFFNRTLKTIGAQFHRLHPFLRRRCGWVVAVLLLGLSSVAAPLRPSVTQQSAVKDQYILPLDLGDDWRTNVNIVNLEEQQANLNLSAYAKDGRFLFEIQTLASLAAKEAKTIHPKTVGQPESETVRLQSPSNVVGSLLFTSLGGTKAEAIPSIAEASQQLDFPPLLHGDGDEKRINLLNTGSSVASLEVIAFEKSGLELGRSILPALSSMASYTLVVRDVFRPEILNQLSTIRIISDSPIVGVQLVDPADGDLVGLPALSSTSQEWSFPIWTTGEDVELWTAVGLYNTSAVPISVKVEAFDVENTSLGITETIQLQPGEVHGLTTANISGKILQQTDVLRVTADAPISGYAVVGSIDGRGVTATLGIPAEDKTRVGFELVGSTDKGTLAGSPFARMTDGSVSSIISTTQAGYWSKKRLTAPVSSDSQNVPYWDYQLRDKVPPEVIELAKGILKVSNGYSQLKTGLDTATAVAVALGFLDRPKDRFDILTDQLFDIAGALDWKITEIQRINQRSNMDMAVQTATTALNRKPPERLSLDGDSNHNSGVAVKDAATDLYFLRLTRGKETDGEWKRIIADRPEIVTVEGKLYAWDWRTNLPHLMFLMSQRFAVMAAVDPNFLLTTTFDDELKESRAALLKHYQHMVSGVRCGSMFELPGPTLRVACADIYTGTAAYSRVSTSSCEFYEGTGTPLPLYCPPSVFQEVQRTQDQLRADVLGTMPLAEVRALIDRLSADRLAPLPPAARNPGGYVRAGGGVSSVVYRGASGEIRELSLGSSNWALADLTRATGSPPMEALTKPSPYVGSDGINAVVYRSADGHIHELMLIGNQWGRSDLTVASGAPPAVGSPSAYARSDGYNVVVYRGTDNHIHELLWTGTRWQNGDLTSITGAPVPASDPTGYVRGDGASAVVFRTSDGQIYELLLSGNQWTAASLTALAQGVRGVGNPSAYARSDGGTSVIYRSGDSHVQELFLSGGLQWTAADLTVASGAPTSKTDPMGYNRADGVSAVVFRSSDNHIREMSLSGGKWSTGDLTVFANAPVATDAPAGYVRHDNRTAVVFRSASDEHIRELRLVGTAWQTVDLSAIARVVKPGPGEVLPPSNVATPPLAVAYPRQ
jgi:hypothetical protein